MTCLDVQRFPVQRRSQSPKSWPELKRAAARHSSDFSEIVWAPRVRLAESSAERGVEVVAHRPSYINQLHIPLSAITLRPSAFARLSGIPETEMRGNNQQIGIARDGPVR